MNGYVHYRLTKVWALDTGFSPDDAEKIARADVGVDRELSGHLWRNKRYHFRWLGARRIAREWLDAAVVRHDVRLLGKALHCEQDAISHGHLGLILHWPGIDLWERRSPRMQARIEGVTRTMLREYLSRTTTAPSGESPPGV